MSMKRNIILLIDGLVTGEEKVIWVGCLVVGGETSGMYTAER